MNEVFRDLYRHNQWANEQLLDACAALDEAQLNAGNPGAYGTIAETLTHLVGAEQRYLWMLTGQQSDLSVFESEGFPGFERLRAAARQAGAGLTERAAQAEPGRILRGERRGEPYAIPAEIVLIQVINHATEHRTNVTTILAQLGVEPPEIDGWAFREQVTAG